MSKEHSTKGQGLRSGLGLAGLLVALVLVVGGVQNLPAWRADLTEDRLYTLTDGTRAILSKMEQPVTLEFFFSDKASQELPQLRDYAKRVRELLQEYSLVSGGKIRLSIVDPEPFSEEEDKAAEYGLQGVPASVGGDAVYFGLVGYGSSDTDDGEAKRQVISFFNQQREAFLEYDISQLIYQLADSSPTVVGVLTNENAMGGYDFARRQPGETWLVIEQLQKLANVRKLNTNLERIDDDVDVLMVIHPNDLSEQSRYAIDQYVLGGGKALIFVDPHFEMAAGGMMAMPAANSSDLPALFKAWGISYNPTRVVGDAKWALRLAAGDNNLPLPHLGILGLQSDSLIADDITTANLETINMATAGALAATPNARTRFTALLSSSDLAMPMASSQFVALRDHSQLLKTFEPTGEHYTLAARVQGPASTAFPDGRPKAPADDNGAEADAGEVDQEEVDQEKVDQEQVGKEKTAADDDSEPAVAEAPSPDSEHLTESKGDINVLIVADTDLLTDRLWVQVSSFFGQRVAAPWANNGDFVANAVENLAGSADLISVRSRGKYSRPFERVDELELKAAQRFREQEQLLIEKLEELETKIRQLSQDESGQTVLTLTPEQQAEVEAFGQEKLEIRKELRQVQHQLNRDIEALEWRMKLINIVLVPGLLTLGVVGLAMSRARNRR